MADPHAVDDNWLLEEDEEDQSHFVRSVIISR